MTTKAKRKQAGPQYRMVNGRRMVMLRQADYERLLQKADLWEPLLPKANADGNYPAREYMLASIARDIIRHRRRLGLSQAELARQAGIRPETLKRIEHATHSPSVTTVAKIDRALKEAEEASGRRE
jgi:ribosome-binding protein aMBF1 (putative translation factor)